MTGKDSDVRAAATKMEPAENGTKVESVARKNGVEVKKEEDLKLEAKKEEMKAEVSETDAGDEKKDKKRRRESDEGHKEKKRKKDKADGEDGEEEENMLGMLESEVDLSTVPQSLVIEGSAKKSCNGTYKLMAERSRGYPAYELQKKDRAMYLYRSKGAWKLAPELGSTKYSMFCDDAGLPVPLEPYPHLWKYYEKDSLMIKREAISYGMRVIDPSIPESIEELPLQPLEPSVGDAASSTGTEASPGRRKTHHHREHHHKHKDKDAASPTKAEAASSEANAKKEKEAKEAEAKEEEKALRASLTSMKLAALKRRAREDKVDAGLVDAVDEADDPKAALMDLIVEASKKAKQAAAAAAEAPADEQASSGSDSSESEAESESSEVSSSSSEAPADREQQQDKTQDARAAAEALEKKGKDFEAKLRMQLSKIKDQSDLRKKLSALKEHMVASAAKMKEEYGFSLEKVLELLKDLEKQFAKPQQKGPPKHLGKNDLGGPAPATPPEDLRRASPTTIRHDPDGLPHKTVQPGKSKLKAPWGSRRTMNRIRYVDHVGGILRTEQFVESFKSAGETLWYIQPGATVICDSCERVVPQSCGQLQGEPNRSQFAHSRFLCSECIIAGH